MRTTDDVTATKPARLLTFATLPFFIGGFLGPFGTTLVISIYPELRASFDASTAAVNWSFSGYLLPMAALMLVSGTIGERYGRARVTRVVFVTYSAASVLAAIAPTLGLFIAARVLQGIANAFITPLLLAGLIEIMPAAKSGRAVGIYSSFQAAGAGASPLVAGWLATIDWRWVFVVVAVVSLGLAFHPPPGAPRPGAEAPRLRPLLTRRMGDLWGAAFAGAAGPLGIPVLVGLYLRDELDVGSAAAGVVLGIGSVVAAFASPGWGQLLDRWGPRRSATFAFGVAMAAIAPVGLVTDPVAVAGLMIVISSVVAFAIVVLQQLAALAVPENRGGGASSVLAFRFAGHAIGPLVLVPVHSRSPTLAFVLAAALGVPALAGLIAATVGNGGARDG